MGALTQGTVRASGGEAHPTGIRPKGYTANQNPDPGEATLAGWYPTSNGSGLTLDGKVFSQNPNDTAHVNYQFYKK